MEQKIESLEKKVKMGRIKKAVLASIGATGFIAIALIAPHSLKILKLFGVDKKWKNLKN